MTSVPIRRIGDQERPPAPRRAWDVADEQLERYRARLLQQPDRDSSIAAACRAKIDDWLDYRSQYGPDDMEAAP